MIYQLTSNDWQDILAIAEKRYRTEGKREDADLLGAAGEYAFSKLFNLPAPNTQAEEDAGWDFELNGVTVDVKTVSDDLHVVSLLVPKHGRAGVYVLCHLDYDTKIVTFVGWISGGEAKTYGRIASWGKHYKVPINLLHEWSIFYRSQAPTMAVDDC